MKNSSYGETARGSQVDQLAASADPSHIGKALVASHCSENQVGPLVVGIDPPGDKVSQSQHV